MKIFICEDFICEDLPVYRGVGVQRCRGVATQRCRGAGPVPRSFQSGDGGKRKTENEKGKSRKDLRYYMLTSYMEKVRKGKQGQGTKEGGNGKRILEQYFQRVVDCDVILNCRRCNRNLRAQCPIFYGKKVSERNLIARLKSGRLDIPESNKLLQYRRTCATMQLIWILDKTKRWKKVEID